MLVAVWSQTCFSFFLRVFPMDLGAQLHTGTCRGQGLKKKGYHGYSVHDPSEGMVENLCACCDLSCKACSTWARNHLRNLSWNLPVKWPPASPPYDLQYKAPPPKRSLHFKPDDGGLSFLHLIPCYFLPLCIAGDAAVTAQDGHASGSTLHF